MTCKPEDIVIYAGQFKGKHLSDLTLSQLKEFSKSQEFFTMNKTIKLWVKAQTNRKHHTRDFWQEWAIEAGVDDIDEDINIFRYEIKHFDSDSPKKGIHVRKSNRGISGTSTRQRSRGVVAWRQQNDDDWGETK